MNITQASSFPPLKSINSTSFSPSNPSNLCISPNFRTNPFKNSFKISSSSSNSDPQSSSSSPTPENSENPNSNGGGKKEIPLAVKLAMEKAKEYKKKKGESGSSQIQEIKEESGLEKTVPKSTGNRKVEKVSSIDFVGLNFSDKKITRGLPAGLVPMENNFSDAVLSDVEMIRGDISKFGPRSPSELNEQDDSDLYKPKVSTWGVFPRPNNISKTFGGGRTIRPGDVLETEEDKSAKDARTKQLVSAYKKKVGLNIDPKLKASCEKALNEGDTLMDKGRLKEALPFYEKVMKDLAFQTELHGLAALQWSICQDSLSRQKEARVMYEKLQTHPNPTVKKKAKTFMFGFQAMEILKVQNSSLTVKTTDYQNYFEAFVQDKPNYSLRANEEGEKDGSFQQVIPYILFLAFPIVFILVIAARKGL
ncbi:hypothetical protein ACHQM5_018902 [Ranunculus cassubicifolius]